MSTEPTGRRPPRQGRVRRLLQQWRPSTITLGAPVLPLAVLFGLNAVDELDRSAFAVLLPDIRDHFGLSNAAALGLVAATTIAIVLIEVPLAFYADRGSRMRIAAAGAAVWAVFSAGTGLAVSVGMLAIARVGAGVGKAVVTPTHSSLLADFYTPQARVKVFSAHRVASSVGQILGPVLAGALAVALGWRAPFLLFAIPTAVLVVIALRVPEPVRGRYERLAAGADETIAAREEPPESPWRSIRVLAAVRTVRRVWAAAPFLGIALFGVPTLLSLIYEERFELSAAERGLVAAGVEPLQIVGIVVAMPLVSHLSARDPGVLLRFVALVGVIDAALLVLLAAAPHVGVAVVVHAVLAASIGTLVPAFLALVSLVAPPRVRSAAFSTMSVFAIPGVAVVLPLLGAVSDAHGIQASLLVLVPVAVAAGLILASAARFVAADIQSVRQESLARVAGLALTTPVGASGLTADPAVASRARAVATVES